VVAIGNFGLLKPILRRQFLKAVGIRYDEDPAIKIGEDSLFYISCLITGAPMLLTNEPLYFYRRHPASLTHSMSADSVRVCNNKNRELLTRLGAETGSSLAKVIEQTLADQADIVAYFELIELLRGRRWMTAWRRFLASRGRTLFLLRRAAQGLAGRISESQLRRSIAKRIRARSRLERRDA
jgi:succinoglycan biosynthesis protein ExoO